MIQKFQDNFKYLQQIVKHITDLSLLSININLISRLDFISPQLTTLKFQAITSENQMAILRYLYEDSKCNLEEFELNESVGSARYFFDSNMNTNFSELVRFILCKMSHLRQLSFVKQCDEPLTEDNCIPFDDMIREYDDIPLWNNLRSLKWNFVHNTMGVIETGFGANNNDDEKNGDEEDREPAHKNCVCDLCKIMLIKCRNLQELELVSLNGLCFGNIFRDNVYLTHKFKFENIKVIKLNIERIDDNELFLQYLNECNVRLQEIDIMVDMEWDEAFKIFLRKQLCDHDVLSDVTLRMKLVINESKLHERKMVNLQKLYDLLIDVFNDKMIRKRREFRLNFDIYYGSINTNAFNVSDEMKKKFKLISSYPKELSQVLDLISNGISNLSVVCGEFKFEYRLMYENGGFRKEINEMKTENNWILSRDSSEVKSTHTSHWFDSPSLKLRFVDITNMKLVLQRECIPIQNIKQSRKLIGIYQHLW